MNKEILIKESALNTLQIEAETLRALKAKIDTIFVSTVEALETCKGRVIVSGIGKSALVAKKIVATFNSTGTPAIFMHAADAVHGDLGMIQPDDIVLFLSKSGETGELKVLTPLLKSQGTLIIAMVSNPKSYLAKRADYFLHLPISVEADPNNLAPTSSTTAQMAMGDAIAIALLALRGFTPQDFAQFHPGGILGKQLYLRVHDLYINNEKPQVQADATIRQTILEMTSKRLGMTAVLDDTHRLLGIITDGDLRRMLERESETKHLTAKDIMTANPITISEFDLAVDALTCMRKHSITQLVVMNEQQYVGVIHLHDLIREGII